MAKLPHDPVKSPRHYTSGKVECIDAIESALGQEGFLAFLRGQVIKYQWRLGMKDSAAQDAGKAQWYGGLLEERLKEADAKAARQAAKADAYRKAYSAGGVHPLSPTARTSDKHPEVPGEMVLSSYLRQAADPATAAAVASFDFLTADLSELEFRTLSTGAVFQPSTTTTNLGEAQTDEKKAQNHDHPATSRNTCPNSQLDWDGQCSFCRSSD